jgi:hypothetical protein
VIPALVSLSLKAEFPEDVRNSLRDKGVGSPNCTICELLDLRFLSDSENTGAFFAVTSSQCPLGRQALIRHARWFLKPRAILAKSYEASGKNNKNPAARPAKNATYVPSRPVPRNRSERKNSATPANIAVHLSLDANAVRLCWFFRDCRTARTDITTFAIAAAPSSVLDIGTFILPPDCPWMLQGLIGLAD